MTLGMPSVPSPDAPPIIGGAIRIGLKTLVQHITSQLELTGLLQSVRTSSMSIIQLIILLYTRSPGDSKSAVFCY